MKLWKRKLEKGEDSRRKLELEREIVESLNWNYETNKTKIYIYI